MYPQPVCLVLGLVLVGWQLEVNLDRLRAAVEGLLVEISRLFPKKKQRSIFLINNYDLILAVLKVCAQKQAAPAPAFGHRASLDQSCSLSCCLRSSEWLVLGAWLLRCWSAGGGGGGREDAAAL